MANTSRKLVVPPSSIKSNTNPPLTKNPIKGFSIQVRSRHPTHDGFRTKNIRLPFRSVVRLGSTTDLDDTISNGGNRIECNTINAIKNSSSKSLMKQCFLKNGVRTAEYEDNLNKEKVIAFFTKNSKTGIVIKSYLGSRNNGNHYIKTKEQLTTYLEKNPIANHIVEKYYNFSREYRLHVTKERCFYTCRKMLKSDTPENQRWYRNDNNCVWILEENENFDKPANWETIVEQSIKALNSVGLDIGAIDVRVQSAKDSKGKIRKECDFIILETNSAPSFGDITLQRYIQEIPKVLISKSKN